MMRSLPTATALVAAALLVLSSLAAAQVGYVTQVHAFAPGLGSPSTSTVDVLGGPTGLDATQVLSLGRGGMVSLGFASPIVDGPGADFIVFENGFEWPIGSGHVFGECVFVEVSSNGIDYARFPSRYEGLDASHGAFATVPMGSFSGLAGGAPVLADVVANTIDPGNCAIAGGDAFDLADLAGDPLVQIGLVELDAVTHVRLIDVADGVMVDSFGNTIWDCYGVPNDGADIDAVAVINSAATAGQHRPDVDVRYDAFGHLEVVLANGAGLFDFDAASFVLTVDFVPLTGALIGQGFVVASITATEIVLRTPFPIAGSQIPTLIFGAAIGSVSGGRSSDQIDLQNG